MEGEWVLRQILKAVITAILAGVTVAIANGSFEQHWNFFIVWLIWFLAVSGVWFFFITIGDGEIDIS